MHGTITAIRPPHSVSPFQPGHIIVGAIVRVTPEGMAIVDAPGSLPGPVAARSVVMSSPYEPGHDVGRSVLIVLENGDPSLPIILGFIHNKLHQESDLEKRAWPVERPQDALIDNRRIQIDAREEILLTCGKSSIHLKKDGRVIVKGTKILSRASETNRIKGASVEIN